MVRNCLRLGFSFENGSGSIKIPSFLQSWNVVPHCRQREDSLSQRIQCRACPGGKYCFTSNKRVFQTCLDLQLQSSWLLRRLFSAALVSLGSFCMKVSFLCSFTASRPLCGPNVSSCLQLYRPHVSRAPPGGR